jgi:hypothetical protein
MTIYHASKAAEKTEYGLVSHGVYSSESNGHLIVALVYNKYLYPANAYTAYKFTGPDATAHVAVGSAPTSFEALAL